MLDLVFFDFKAAKGGHGARAALTPRVNMDLGE